MPGTFTYGLYPFPWDDVAKCHAPPAGSACVLDLRPLSEQAKSSQSGGYGLFAWESGAPGDLISLGTGYAPTLAINNAARVELRTKLGLSANPSGATLADAMADVLGSLADPTGASMAKPLMPTSDGTLEIHLSGHSRVWSAKIDAADVLSASPKGRHNRIRDVIRDDLDEAERVGGLPLLQKCLGAWLLKCGMSREEVAAGASGKKSQYDRLMSAAVKAKHGANAKPRVPSTSFAETWPTNCANIEDTPQGNSWLVDGTAAIEVASGFAYSGATGNPTKVGRCTSAVSSADHITSALLTTTGDFYVGLLARRSNSAVTSYAYYNFYGYGGRLAKFVGGAETSLGDEIFAGNFSGEAWSIRASGSTITGKAAGHPDRVSTDTAVTGHLFGGVMMLGNTVKTSNKVGAWSIDDELGGGGSSSRNPSSLGMLGVG